MLNLRSSEIRRSAGVHSAVYVAVVAGRSSTFKLSSLVKRECRKSFQRKLYFLRESGEQRSLWIERVLVQVPHVDFEIGRKIERKKIKVFLILLCCVHCLEITEFMTFWLAGLINSWRFSTCQYMVKCSL